MSTQPQTAPRHFVHGTMGVCGGLPHDRLSRMAARRAFVLLKQPFLDAVGALHCPHGSWLREQVRAAEDPSDLWLLRAPVFAALRGTDPAHQQLRRRLRRSLATLFPHASSETTFASLFGSL